MKKAIQIITTFLFLLMPPRRFCQQSTLAQDAVTCESDVVVQADDWLSKIADKFYGNRPSFPGYC